MRMVPDTRLPWVLHSAFQAARVRGPGRLGKDVPDVMVRRAATDGQVALQRGLEAPVARALARPGATVTVFPCFRLWGARYLTS